MPSRHAVFVEVKGKRTKGWICTNPECNTRTMREPKETDQQLQARAENEARLILPRPRLLIFQPIH